MNAQEIEAKDVKQIGKAHVEVFKIQNFERTQALKNI